MTTILFSRYRSCNLDELVERLDNDYYKTIQALCVNVTTLADRLMQESSHASTVLYSSMALKLTHKINNVILARKKELLPYILELHTKKAEGHDCSNCSGICHVGHAERLMDLRESHQAIKEHQKQLETESLPMYADIVYPSTYKILRNEMTVMDNMLTEVFYIEESHLIPKVFEAQKAINA